MPINTLLPPQFKTLVASAAQTTTFTSSAFSMPVVPGGEYSFILNASTVTGTTPTLDAVLQTSVDKGTTYVNLPLRTTQVTAAGVRWMTLRLGPAMGSTASESPAADTGGTLAKDCVFDPQYMKIKCTIGGTNPSFTMALYGGVVQE